MNTQTRPQLHAVPGAGVPAMTRQPAAMNVTPALRAAVIIALLGEGAARPIVEKLDDAALARVVRELETIHVLPRDVLIEIVIDFLGHLNSNNGALRGGRERAREMMGTVIDPRRLSLIMGEHQPEEEDEPAAYVSTADAAVWTRVQKKEPRLVAEYLSRLTPNLISLILGKLDVSFTSDVLCFLDEAKLAPVMGCMVQADKPDPGIESVIARMVQMEFLNAAQAVEEDDTAHLEAIGELLSLIPSSRRENVVQFLKTEHEGKLASIEKAILTIESLPDMLVRNSVPVLFREIEDTTITKVLGILQDSKPEVADYLLGNISSRMADQFRDNLEGFRAPPAEEAETILRDFLSTIMGLKQQGLVTLQKAEKAAS